MSRHQARQNTITANHARSVAENLGVEIVKNQINSSKYDYRLEKDGQVLRTGLKNFSTVLEQLNYIANELASQEIKEAQQEALAQKNEKLKNIEPEEPAQETEVQVPGYDQIKPVVLEKLNVEDTKGIKAWMKGQGVEISLATNEGWRQLLQAVENWEVAGKPEPIYQVTPKQPKESVPEVPGYDQIKPVVLEKLNVEDTKGIKNWLKAQGLNISLATNEGWRQLLQAVEQSTQQAA